MVIQETIAQLCTTQAYWKKVPVATFLQNDYAVNYIAHFVIL